MKERKERLTLDRPAIYEIKVPAALDPTWTDWIGEMTLVVEVESDGSPVTTLTGVLDQAALQGLLRHLYALGLPLISAVCVASAPADGTDTSC